MIAEKVAAGKKKGFRVSGGEIEIRGKNYKIGIPDDFYIFRKMTVKECERLQTMPEGYTKKASAAQAYKMLGNGWTAEVIKHIVAAANIQKDEELIVLSLYDGIGTGRYVLDALGYKNVTYYAYEIDEPAIEVAKDNYPDIIERGDAFQVRADDWKL